MLEHELAHGVLVVAPDRVGHPACEDEPRPARQTVASREHELGVGEPCVERPDLPGVMRPELGDG
jgi:hypothetical protein